MHLTPPPQTGPTEFHLDYDPARDQYLLTVNALGTTQSVVLPDDLVATLAARALALRHGIGNKPTLEMDDTTARLIGMAHQVNAQEPQEPNGNMPQALQDEVARAHAHWDDQRAAYRLLVATRLASIALDDQ